MVRYSSNNDEPEKSEAVQEPVPRSPVPNPLIARYRLEVEKRLSEIYSSDSWISAAANEAIRAGGKRLRPFLAVLTCEAICGNPEPAFPVALAYELAHAASLIQDDIIDESAVRHASPTAYKRFGLARAIMLSDSMIFEIFALMARYNNTDAPEGWVGPTPRAPRARGQPRGRGRDARGSPFQEGRHKDGGVHQGDRSEDGRPLRGERSLRARSSRGLTRRSSPRCTSLASRWEWRSR